MLFTLSYLFRRPFFTRAQFIATCEGGAIVRTAHSSDWKTSFSQYAQVTEKGSYGEGELIGSFCPNEEMGVELRVVGNGWGQFNLPNSKKLELNADYSVLWGLILTPDDCETPKVVSTINMNFKFTAHRCYPYQFKLQGFGGCGYDLLFFNTQKKISLSLNHPTTHQILGPELSFRCQDYDNCLPGYYGSECQNHVDIPEDTPEDQLCQMDLGDEGTGKCLDCQNSPEIQAACYNTDTDKYDKGARLQRKTLDGDWVNDRALTTVNIEGEGDYFDQYRVSGYILIPEGQTPYSFKLASKTNAYLKVGDAEKGKKENTLFCNPAQDSYIEYDIEYANTQEVVHVVPFEIYFESGCALNYYEVALKWKRQGSSSYEVIPAKYILQKQTK